MFNSKITRVVLLLTALLFIGGCSDEKKVAGEAKGNPANVWYTSGTQKIRPDIDAKEYKDVQISGLNVKTGRLEYESAQIIMTAKKDIKSYDISVSDLTLTSDASVTLSKDNIEVFNQHYIQCDKVFEGSDLTSPGLYPDALIPFDAAKEYGENTVKKGSSQGLWVTFYAPKGQKAGEYTGTFMLEMDGYKQEVPVSVNVWDFDYAENYTAENCFLIDWATVAYGELDTSQDIYDAYAEALLDYRLQPDLLMNDLSTASEEDMKTYADKVLKFAQDERCTVVFMPFAYHNRTGDTSLDEANMKKWIRSFVDVSLNSYGTEQQMNLIEKTMIYFIIIDEPHINTGLIPRTNKVSADLARFRTEIKQEYLEKLGDQKSSGLSADEYAFRLEVINDIEGISHVLTGQRDERIEGVEVYCPPIQTYETEEARAQYANDKERWWYTCVGPHYPYPTYHIDDTNGLISSRVMSWMQSEYNVIGNLYWSTNLYMSFNGRREFIEDVYTTPERFTGANGDGFLFYPGKKYGINGPIGTIRLQAIRDGLEEFETLEALKKIYSQIDAEVSIDVDFQTIYSKMVEDLYSGCSVYTTQAYFDEARELFANLAELATIKGAVADVTSGEKELVVSMILPSDVKVKYEGGTTKTQQFGKYTLYTMSQPNSEETKVFKCMVEGQGKEIALELELGGSVKEYLASQLVQSISVGVRNMTKLTESSNVIAKNIDASAKQDVWTHVKLPQADGRMQQNMVISDSELFSNVGPDTKKIVIKLYYNSNKAMDNQGVYPYALQFKFANEQLYSYVREAKLVNGYNEITIGNMFSYDWENLGQLKDIRLLFGDPESPEENQLYFIGVDVYAE